MANKKIEDKTVFLYNRGDCDFSFKPFGMATFVNIPTNIRVKNMGFPIKVDLLRNTVMNDIGVLRKFEDGSLYVEDKEVVDFLMLPTEYHRLYRTYDEILKLLNDSERELENYLNEIMDDENYDDCKQMVDLITKAALDIKLNNLDKIQLIVDYTGIRIDEPLEAIRAEEDLKKESKTTKKKVNKRGKESEEE